MQCLNYLKNRFPCGQCMACRINRQSEKALRITHELEYHKDNVFVTLTYKPECLPEHASLVKRDVQLFLKRLRKAIEPQQIRYFLCGEYGETFSRPHYHLIIFGISQFDPRVFTQRKYIPSQDVYYCACKCWDKGFVSIGAVNTARVAYVAKYVIKKVTGKGEKEYYGDKLPEFSLCSRKPGLGYQYAIDHANKLKKDDFCTVRGVKRPMPRYYVEKLFSNVEKIERSHRRDDAIVEMLEKQRPEWEECGIKYGQLLKDKLEAAKRILGVQIQRKGKSKCQID